MEEKDKRDFNIYRQGFDGVDGDPLLIINLRLSHHAMSYSHFLFIIMISLNLIHKSFHIF
jgi:hypothetical protein